ncbi:MAG: c-type cytochrome domain-containing protein [Singulisphaera sp.]
MLTDESLEGREALKVLDFGIAKVLGGSAPDAGPLTGPGEFFGTPRYASPEHIRGDEIDARSDIYSAGVLLYELVTGHRPFGGLTPSLLGAHLHAAPPAFARINPAVRVPAAVEARVLRCQAKDPAARPQSARELAEAFRTALGAGPTTRTAHGLRARPRRAIAAALVLVLVAGEGPGPLPHTPTELVKQAAEASSKPNPPPRHPVGTRRAGHKVFSERCVECHRPGEARGGLVILDRGRLVHSGAVVPNRPDESDLYRRVVARDESVMPPRGPRLDAAAIADLRGWIAVGPARRASPPPDDPSCSRRSRRRPAAPPAERRFFRYFSLHHLRLSARGAGPARQRWPLAINHLSAKPALVRPRPIDAGGGLLRVDLRDLGWDATPFRKMVADELGRAQPGEPVRPGAAGNTLRALDRGRPCSPSQEAFLDPAGQVGRSPMSGPTGSWPATLQSPLYEDFLRLPSTWTASDGGSASSAWGPRPTPNGHAGPG